MPEPTPDIITIRMYRGILGDCFLLTHRLGKTGAPFHALIDCGVLQCIGAAKPNTKAGVGHMDSVVANLKTETGGTIDLMIATHEHYDHLAGFVLGFEVMKTLTIKKLWVAWTENRADELAEDIRDRGKKAVSALQAFVDLAGTEPALAADPSVKTVSDLLQFYGDIEPYHPDSDQGFTRSLPPVVSLDKKPLSIAAVIEWLKLKVGGDDNVEYLMPGQMVQFGVDNRLTAYVLGPPRTKRLLQLNPTGGDGREVYLVAREGTALSNVYLTSPDAIVALTSTLKLRMAGPAGDAAVRSSTKDQPFSPHYRLTREAAETFEPFKRYFDPDEKGRTIEKDWVGSAEDLALKIDNDVNNTSLALAIETPGPKHVLLFPADAQVGNWLSWHDQRYPHDPQNPAAGQTASDLLRRTVLYKVGHHGSHNATARDMGLELMTSPLLSAMIPVVVEVAAEQKNKNTPNGWAMPYGPLSARLKEKTGGRIVQGDGDPVEEAKAFANHPLFTLAYPTDGSGLWAELTMVCG